VVSLEDRALPSGTPFAPAGALAARVSAAATSHTRPFHEELTLVSVSQTGVLSYAGDASYLGHITALLNPDNTFTKVAANGDTVTGFLRQRSETTGIIRITGGSGLYEGAKGRSRYVISQHEQTGATTVEVDGDITLSRAAFRRRHDKPQAVPFRADGGGDAPQGINVMPNTTAPHDATGTTTLMRRYTGDGVFTNLGFTSPTTGIFTGHYTFVARNGDRLAFRYGAATPGTYTLLPSTEAGKVIVEFVAVFTPVPEESTGRFAKVTGGSFIMIATTEPLVPVPDAQGNTEPFAYTWHGEGVLEFER
jgi:hypothetical protein